nr:hypothetical protein [Micromonospora sp. DSM 115978]
MVLLPLKPLTGAKSRLLRPDRGALALAMATDAVSAALAVETSLVAVVVLVTDDARARAALRPARRLVHLPDTGGGGLNPALRAAAADAGRRWPGFGV